MSKCGECTLCCYLLPVPELDKEINQECVNCAVNKGCKIWDKRPTVCRTFECAYYQMDKVSLDLRPDKCKVVFEKIADNIFFGTQDPRFSMTVVAKKQISSFNQQGFSVIIATEGKSKSYLAPDHTQEQVKLEVSKYLEKRNGRT